MNYNKVVRSYICKKEASMGEFMDKIKNKFNIGFSTKDKAKKWLLENVKDESDIDEAYKSIPKILKFIKKSYEEDLKLSEALPKTFVRNALILIALTSLFEGSFPSKADIAKNKLKKEKIIKVNHTFLGKVPVRKIKEIMEETGDKSLHLIKEKFLEEYHKNPDNIFYTGKKIPKDTKPYSLLLSEDKNSSFLHNPEMIKKIDNNSGYVYLSLDK